MTLWSPRNRLIACLALAGTGLALFFGGDLPGLGLPLGFVGIWLFVIAVWFLVDAITRIPRSEAEIEIAPGEWQAWIGLAFVTAAIVALLQKSAAFVPQVPIFDNPDASRVGGNIGTLFVAWIVLTHVLKMRWKELVQFDERDLQIEQMASHWGRAATAFCIIGIALMLGFSPTDRLQQFSYPFLAQMLIFALLWGVWFDCFVAAFLYRRDRRAVRS